VLCFGFFVCIIKLFGCYLKKTKIHILEFDSIEPSGLSLPVKNDLIEIQKMIFTEFDDRTARYAERANSAAKDNEEKSGSEEAPEQPQDADDRIPF